MARTLSSKNAALAVGAMAVLAVAGGKGEVSAQDLAAHDPPLCVRAAEKSALDLRVLQTELMVAALNCGEFKRYNSFIRKFAREIRSGGKVLRGVFAEPKTGGTSLNQFVTRLANQASLRSATEGSGYCRRAAAVFADVLAAHPSRLASLTAAQPFTSAHGFAVCSVDARPKTSNAISR